MITYHLYPKYPGFPEDLNTYSIICEKDIDRIRVSAIFKKMKEGKIMALPYWA